MRLFTRDFSGIYLFFLLFLLFLLYTFIFPLFAKGYKITPAFFKGGGGKRKVEIQKRFSNDIVRRLDFFKKYVIILITQFCVISFIEMEAVLWRSVIIIYGSF